MIRTTSQVAKSYMRSDSSAIGPGVNPELLQTLSKILSEGNKITGTNSRMDYVFKTLTATFPTTKWNLVSTNNHHDYGYIGNNNVWLVDRRTNNGNHYDTILWVIE